ncbi:hypothetical protein APR50_24120 [Variovorax paradoxus]|nr:hypothetical protein APR52_28950 [Variovorax paradoxus]KPV03672.1 hypothetical protein APR50_24120 [Variovorax paradoxus]KPV06057.1 hypothetical protein APR49_20615 [Variovorax paradoxus]KPV19063.1 hypothetical protein APR51_21530 [Variovorax paradoxus]KPV29806.1 hypothetical protein APR48_21645 [Variovorax paradoxus]
MARQIARPFECFLHEPFIRRRQLRLQSLYLAHMTFLVNVEREDARRPFRRCIGWGSRNHDLGEQ